MGMGWPDLDRTQGSVGLLVLLDLILIISDLTNRNNDQARALLGILVTL